MTEIDTTHDRALHSAPGPEEPTIEGVSAGAGARPREASALWLRLAAAARWLRSELSPPDVWTQPRPSLRQVVTYALRGAWTAETGLARVLGVAYMGAVAVPLAAVGYTLVWIVERPARLAAAAALYAALLHMPLVSTVTRLMLAPVFWIVP